MAPSYDEVALVHRKQSDRLQEHTACSLKARQRERGMAPSKQHNGIHRKEPDGQDTDMDGGMGKECLGSIDKLISVGIKAGDVKKLQQAGFKNINDLMVCGKNQLAEINGFSEVKIDIVFRALVKLQAQEYKLGNDLVIKGNYVKEITAGDQALEELLCGDLKNHQAAHSLENFRSGKSHLTHTLCVTSQLSVKGDELRSKVAYIDTLGLFNPDCITTIAEIYGIDGPSALQNITHARADSIEKIEQLCSGLTANMAEEPFRLLIIDSVTPLLSSEAGSDLAHFECQDKLTHMLLHLSMLAQKYNITVYLTNRDGDEMKVVDIKDTPEVEEVPNIDKESVKCVTVSTAAGVLTLNVKPSDTIGSLVETIERETELPQGSQYVTYHGKLLRHETQLADWNLSANTRLESHTRLRGGARDKSGGQKFADFLAKDNNTKSILSDGVPLHYNKMAKEILIDYPQGRRRRYAQVTRTILTPLSCSLFLSMLKKVKKAHRNDKSWGGINWDTFIVVGSKVKVDTEPQEALDDKNAKEDYKGLNRLFSKCAELSGRQPVYLPNLCKNMVGATRSLAKDSKFHLFLQIHPCFMTYSIRSAFFWEVVREFLSMTAMDQKSFNKDIDGIQPPKHWQYYAQKEEIFYETLRRQNYADSSSGCFRFLRNWLTHGKENFAKVDSRRISPKAMDYLIEYYFGDFLAEIVWLLIQKHYHGMSEWFEDQVKVKP